VIKVTKVLLRTKLNGLIFGIRESSKQFAPVEAEEGKW
jgi:hypothetical protein